MHFWVWDTNNKSFFKIKFSLFASLSHPDPSIPGAHETLPPRIPVSQQARASLNNDKSKTTWRKYVARQCFKYLLTQYGGNPVWIWGKSCLDLMPSRKCTERLLFFK
jgi:hypothetical protein